jgi:predicted DNA-binding transcriptional regulator AlpA
MRSAVAGNFEEQLSLTTSVLPNTGAMPVMFSVPDFCEAHGISKAFFYKLHKQGKAPPICKVGARSLITAEAAAEWRRSLEQEAA